MRVKSLFALMVLFTIVLMSCQGNNKNTEAFSKYQREMGSQDETAFQDMQNDEVMVYYFHATRRCATCQAVENVTKETIEANYAGKVVFESINREENKDNALIEQYKINGQTLLIIKGGEVVNLTTEAFMNARTSPEKFAAKLKSTIDELL